MKRVTGISNEPLEQRRNLLYQASQRLSYMDHETIAAALVGIYGASEEQARAAVAEAVAMREATEAMWNGAPRAELERLALTMDERAARATDSGARKRAEACAAALRENAHATEDSDAN